MEPPFCELGSVSGFCPESRWRATALDSASQKLGKNAPGGQSRVFLASCLRRACFCG